MELLADMGVEILLLDGRCEKPLPAASLNRGSISDISGSLRFLSLSATAS